MSFAEVTFSVSSSSHSPRSLYEVIFRRGLAIRGNRAHNPKCLPAVRGTKYLRRTWGRGGFAAGADPVPPFRVPARAGIRKVSHAPGVTNPRWVVLRAGQTRSHAMLYWLRARADHEAPPRRERRQRTVDCDRRDGAARTARRRGRDAPEREVLADGARVRRRTAHPGGRGQAREHRLADASLLPGRGRIRPAGSAAYPPPHDRRTSRGRFDDRPSSGAVSRCSCLGSGKERSSDCTRRAFWSGSGRRRSTC